MEMERAMQRADLIGIVIPSWLAGKTDEMSNGQNLTPSCNKSPTINVGF